MGRTVICVDANILIRIYEGSPDDREHLHKHLGGVAIAVSALARLECRVKPLKDGDRSLLARYDEVFASTALSIVPIDGRCLDIATELRATFGYGTPDAIHLAAAVVSGCDLFLTGDRQLRRCTQINVEIV